MPDLTSELEKPADASDVNTPRGESAKAEVVRLRALLAASMEATEATGETFTFSVRIAKKKGMFDVTMESPPAAGHEAPEQASGGTWTYVSVSGSGKEWNAWFERGELDTSLGLAAEATAADAAKALSTRLKPVGASLTIAKEEIPQEEAAAAAAPAEGEAEAAAEAAPEGETYTHETLGGETVATPAAAEAEAES